MHIVFEKSVEEETFKLLIQPDDTCATVKAKIQDQKGLDFDMQRLFFDGIQLEDGKSLSDYNIKHKSRVQLVLKIKVIIEQLGVDGTFDLDVEPTDTDAVLKARIQDKTGIPFSKQILNFKGTDIEGGKTLSEYNVRKKSTINLRLVGQMELTVKNLFGKAWKIVVNTSDKVESLRAKIEEKTGIPEKQFYLNCGKVLEIGRSLSDYEPQLLHFSTVHLLMRLGGCKKCPTGATRVLRKRKL